MKEHLYAELTERLERCRLRLERGEDVAPLEAGRIEGLLVALRLTGESPAAIVAWSGARFATLAPLHITLSANGQLELRLRQARAPVAPSTGAS